MRDLMRRGKVVATAITETDAQYFRNLQTLLDRCEQALIDGLPPPEIKGCDKPECPACGYFNNLRDILIAIRENECNDQGNDPTTR